MDFREQVAYADTTNLPHTEYLQLFFRCDAWH